MGDLMKTDWMKALGSLLFLAIFVLAWGDLLLEFRDFKPQPTAAPPVPVMPVEAFRVGVLGTLVTTLAAAVGAMYGVKVATASLRDGELTAQANASGAQRLLIKLANGFKKLGRGIRDVRFIGGLSTAVYLAFGMTVFFMTLKRSSEAPEVMVSFAGSALAFLGALFTAATTRATD
jgi:hypothetical protein